jgi:uncharacterized protein
MEVRRHDDVESFLAVADAFLVREPARNQLPIAIAHTLSTEPEVYPEFLLWTVEQGGEIVGAAVRTPPHNVALADPTDPTVIAALADRIGVDDPQAPGVVGNRPFCTGFASRWTGRTGQLPRVSVAQGVYELTDVLEPRPCGGAPRRANSGDADLIDAWSEAFLDEALPPELAERHRQRSRGDVETAGMWLWEVDGRPTSMSGSTTIPVGARVGPVYTPPAERGRGYASNLVAHASGEALADGADACFLYTDLANPTSNKIYTDVGYERVCESDNIMFDDPS